MKIVSETLYSRNVLKSQTAYDSENSFGDDLWDVVGWESVLKKKNIILSMNKYRETFCIDLVLTVPQI